MMKFEFQVKQRYVMAAVLFLLLGVSYVLRTNFALLLTQMVYIPPVFADYEMDEDEYDEYVDELFCPVKFTDEDRSDMEDPDNSNRYDWSQEMQGIILSSYYWGNIVSQIPSGLLVQRFGPKPILLYSTLLGGINLLLTPLAVEYAEAFGLIATRVLFGILQGPLISSIGAFSIAWFPIDERGRFNSIVFVGINVFVFLSSHLISYAVSLFGGWSVVFYTLGGVTVISCVLFAFLCFNNPQSHPFISAEEEAYLNSKMNEYLHTEDEKAQTIPWKSIFTSKPVIVLIIAYALFTFGITLSNSGFPKYMNDVLHAPIARNAIFNSIPRLAIIFIAIFVGLMADYLITKKVMTLTKVRKMFAATSIIVTASFMMGASYAGCDDLIVPVLFSIAISGSGFDSAGQDINALDLAPNYIGVLTSIIYTASTGAALLAPSIMGFMVPNAYLTEWRKVFWLAFALYMCSLILYTSFGSAKVQPWNSPQKSESILAEAVSSTQNKTEVIESS